MTAERLTHATGCSCLAEVHRVEQVMAEREDKFRIALKAIEDKLAATSGNAQRALDKAEGAIDRRIESLNEMRGMLQDQATRYVIKAEYDVSHQYLVVKSEENRIAITNLRESRSESHGKSQVWAILLLIVLNLIGVAVTVAVEIMNR